MLSPVRFLTAMAFAGLAIGFVPSAASAQTVTLENITLGSGPVVVRMPRIDFEQPSLGQAELAALFDGSQIDQLGSRLARLSARSIKASEIVVEQDLGVTPGPAKITVNYGSVAFENVANGKAQRMTISGARSNVTDNKGMSMAMTLLPGVASEVDIAGIVRIGTTVAGPQDTQKVLLYRDFSWDGMILEAGDLMTMRFGRMTGADVKMRPLKQSFLELMQGLQVKPGSPPSGDQLRSILRLYADIFDSYEAGTMQFDGMTVEFKDPAKGPGRFDLRKVSIGRFADRGMGDIVVDGIDLKIPDGTFRMGNFTFKAMNASSFVDAVGEMGDADPEEFLSENWRKLLPNFNGLSIRDIAADLPTKPGGSERVKFSLGSFDLTLGAHVMGIPTQISKTIQELFVDLAPLMGDPQIRDMAATLGINAIRASNALSLQWHQDQKVIKVNEALQLDQVGAYSLDGTLGNVVPELFGKDFDIAQVAALGLTVRDVAMRLDNRGGVEKVLAKVAQEQGTTPDVLRQQIAGMAMAVVPQMLGGTPSSLAIGQALASFITNPRSLIVSAKSKSAEGIGFADVMGVANPLELLAKIDLFAKAE